MAGRAWTPEEDALLADLWERQVPAAEVAQRLERTYSSAKKRAIDLGIKWGQGVSRAVIPSANRTIEDLIADRARQYQIKRAHHESKRVGVEIETDGLPFGIFCFGDPHIDDDGADIDLMAAHIELCRSLEGCYAINIGDLSNNWIGRLGRLYAHQHTTDDEAVELVRWLLSALPWAMVILGNHDKWAQIAGILCQDAGVPYSSHGTKIEFRCGQRTLKVDARHDHRGRSQYNPSFGQAKQSYRGNDADVIIGGHTHQGAYTLLRNGVTRKLNHCIRLGSYKRWDDYADANHFDADDVGPACLVVCDPSRDDVGFVQVYWDIEAGAEALRRLRADDLWAARRRV